MPLARLVDGDGNDIKIDNKYLVVKISDGTNFLPAMDVAARRGYVQITDGTDLLKVQHKDFAGLNLSYIGTVAAMYARNNVLDRFDMCLVDTDDDDIASAQRTLLVINLNYVWDPANSKWVRMTQP